MDGSTYLNDMLNMNPEEEFSEVTEFYKGCNVLVTGASGFLGKIIVEKLLRSCKVNRVYAMMRAKKGVSPTERLRQMFELPLFDQLYWKDPTFMNRVTLIEGDTGQVDLALSPENRELLRKNTHIIINGAATVRFNETLRKVVEINVRGVMLMLKFAREMPNLKAFVHISTAFAHCPRKDIEEKYYEIPVSPEKVFGMIELLDDDEIALITPKVISKWPNTYAYSKALGEEIVRLHGSGLPVCIVRPSIVVSVFEEPLRGWADQIYGAIGVSLAAYAGVMRVLHADENCTSEIIPADYAVNNIIVAAWNTWETWNRRIKENVQMTIDVKKIEPTIYNCVTSPQNRLTWKVYKKMGEIQATRVPTARMLYIYRFMLVKTEWLFKILLFLFHTVPAVTGDALARLFRKKPILRMIYRKLHKFSAVLSFFTTQEWNFDNRNVQELWSKMNPVDRERYYFNVERINWPQYVRFLYAGFRVYILKDPMETVNKGFWLYIRISVVHYAIIIFFWISVYYIYSFIFA